MRKLASAFLLSLAISGPAAAQSVVARFLFEQAEAHYAAGDYTSSLAKLDEAEKELGFSNPTVLHLRILGQQELLRTGRYRYADLERQRAHCKTYLKDFGNIESVIEKTREVFNTCDTLKTFPNDALTVANTNFAAFRYEDALADLEAVEKSAKTWSEPLAYLKIRVLEHWVEDEAYQNPDRARVLAREVKTYLAQAEKAKPSPASVEYVQSLDARLAGLEDLLAGLQAQGDASLALLEKAASAGTRVAHYWIGGRFIYGSFGFSRDPARAVEWFRRGAAAGDAMSMNGLGTCYKFAECGLDMDYAEARAWYEKAIALGKGDAYARHNLGVLYANGFGVTQDLVRARDLFEKAAAKGIVESMVEIGAMLWNGTGGPVDKTGAVYWSRRAAERGNPIATSNLGWAYAEGAGVIKDEALARQWTEAAVAKDSKSAMQRLAGWYDAGAMGLPRDPAKAQQLRNQAAAAKAN